jgi:asparagine synthase (glutamine-hydrolysing)
MCGISGQFNFGSSEPVNPTTIRRMADAIAHRGPDDEGFLLDGELGLGFRRLSIIDLAGGHQPMSDTEESVWVAFNGEIYNYPELKRELQQLGHQFRTKSDTEVIIYGYKEWGLDVFSYLNGMFGVAVWDVRRRRLILARDAMGIKLVYYKIRNGQLFFGSEIRAILSGDPENVKIDPIALSLFLRYRFTPSPYTLQRGIKKLAPGTMLIAEAASTLVKRWYTCKPKPFSREPSDNEAAEELLSIYKRAVKRHLLSDVPIGLLLSGGVDSGLLLALMSAEGKGWPTFTVGYGSNYQNDELAHAAETAETFSGRHTAIELNVRTFEHSLGGIISQLEEPVAASSVVPMYFVCHRAKQDVKVALNGQGPDELFGGYKRHLGVRYGSLWAQLPAWARKGIGWGVKQLPRNEMLKRGLESLHLQDRIRRYQAVLSLVPHQTIAGLFHAGALPNGPGDELVGCWEGLIDLMEHTDELGGFQFLEVRSTLPDELLMYADKMSMAHGLEVRVPYLDREVVEFAERLPSSFKVRYGSQKWLHRKVCLQYLPSSITRRKKRGFAVDVVDQWLRQSVSGAMDDIFESADSLMYATLRRDAVLRLLSEHRSGAHDNHKILFSLVVFEKWLRSRFAPTAHVGDDSLRSVLKYAS